MRLDGAHARPVAAFLLAGSLIGFVAGQKAGHLHLTRAQHVTRTSSHVAAPHVTVKSTPPKGVTITHVGNPVASWNPPGAGQGKGDGDGGDNSNGHSGEQGSNHQDNGQGGPNGHGGRQNGNDNGDNGNNSSAHRTASQSGDN